MIIKVAEHLRRQLYHVGREMNAFTGGGVGSAFDSSRLPTRRLILRAAERAPRQAGGPAESDLFLFHQTFAGRTGSTLARPSGRGREELTTEMLGARLALQTHGHMR